MSWASGQFWVLGVNWILGVCLDGPQIGSGLDVMKIGMVVCSAISVPLGYKIAIRIRIH